ncbi:MAG: hypothetical protein ACPHQD_04840 [Vibrio toranzoniae]|jgi:hypothetical protein|uniref:hypothetical protein n=1 Tax=Vibrio toranzoniae TaxID=1194427 RepID=UPI003C4630DA
MGRYVYTLIEGLDDAIIGINHVDDEEVLVYDFGKSVHLLIQAGFDQVDAVTHIEALAASIDPRSPLFVHTRYDAQDYFDDEARPKNATIH